MGKKNIMKDKKGVDNYNLEYAKDHEKDNPEFFGEFKEVLKLYSPFPKEKVLEIGCNTGEFCWLLEEKYKVVPTGIDINEKAIEIAKKKYPHINFYVKDLFDMSGKYDVIYLQHVIEHIKEPDKAFLKINHLLNPGGKLIITCPNNWAYVTKLICWIRNEKFCYDPTHIYEFNPQELSQLVTDAGFNKLKVKTRPGFPFVQRISINLQYKIPMYLFGDVIYILAEKP